MSLTKERNILGLEGVPEDQRAAYLKNFSAHTPGSGREAMLESYDKWADSYDQDFFAHGVFTGPDIAVDAVKRYLPDPACKTIMDMAAGTGIVGQKLYASGYRDIDGNEPSEGMRRVIGDKGINSCFRRIYTLFIDENKTDMPENGYDCVVVSGGFGEGHIPTAGLTELHRITKKGGFVILVLREEYLEYVQEYKGRLEPMMERMRDDGLWTFSERTVVPNYSFKKNGVLYVFQKC